jgi:hypothetical protein
VFRTYKFHTGSWTIVDPYAPSEGDSKRTLKDLKYESYKGAVPISALPTLEELEAEICGWGNVYNRRPHEALRAASPEIQDAILRYHRVADNESSQEAA